MSGARVTVNVVKLAVSAVVGLVSAGESAWFLGFFGATPQVTWPAAIVTGVVAGLVVWFGSRSRPALSLAVTSLGVILFTLPVTIAVVLIYAVVGGG